MQKVMSRDSESRQTEGNLEHEIARPREAQTATEVTLGVSPCRNDYAQTKYYTDFVSMRPWHVCTACVFTLDQLLKIQIVKTLT
jgi:hypothetical protein